MTNYNDWSWHGWNGGECPVHPETVVEVQTYGKNSGSNEDLAFTFSWNGPDTYGDTIIAFRVIKEYITSRANQGPVREVTTVRKEIVPGVYGLLTIRGTDELGPVQLEINGSIGRTWFSKSDVDSLITTLTAIRDAMADSSVGVSTTQAR